MTDYMSDTLIAALVVGAAVIWAGERIVTILRAGSLDAIDDRKIATKRLEEIADRLPPA